MKQKSIWLLSLSILLFIIMLISFMFDYLEFIDAFGPNIKNILSHSGFKTFFLIITNIMSIVGIFIILISTIIIFRKKISKKDMMIYTGSILVCLLVTNLIKLIIKRARPLNMLISVSGYSFPSSHSSISVVVYGFLIILIKKYYQGRKQKLYIILLILLILLTGFSRIYFNVHYITDVVAGFSLGLSFLIISHIIMKKLDKTKKK